MSVLDLLAQNGVPPRITPELQQWLAAVFSDMRAVSHMQFGSGSGEPTLVQLNALFSGDERNGIAVWDDTSSSAYYVFYNIDGTWWQYTTDRAGTASILEYTPAVGADWDDPDPDDVAEALDALATYTHTVTVYRKEITVNTSVNSTVWTDVTGASISHTFSMDNAYIDVNIVAYTGAANFMMLTRLNVGGLVGTSLSGVRDPTVHHIKTADHFDVSSLSGSQTIKLQISRVAGAGTCTAFNRPILNFTIWEWNRL